MCTHGRFVTNRYTKQKFWCKCGKCKSCQQEKAARRSSRIRAEYSKDMSTYFCTLTFDKKSCPYFRQEDLYRLLRSGFDHGNLPLYRNHTVRWDVNKQKYIKVWQRVELDKVFVDLRDIVRDEKGYHINMKWLKKQPHCIGVNYFKDYQLFFKRFRQQIKRYGYDGKIKYFLCDEFGGSSLRPHAHFLLFASPGYDEILHEAFIKSWPYGDRVRAAESFQLVTDDPAGYVSSYINSGSNLHPFLAKNFKCKCSFSKYFGHARSAFSLLEVEKKIDTGYLDYSLSRIRKGIPEVLSLPIPKYVINRFFPLFKGYSRLDYIKVFDYISTNFEYYRLLESSRYYDLNNPRTRIGLTPEDAHKIGVRLRHAFEYYRQFHPNASPVDYAIQYEKAWRSYKSTVYRFFMEDDSVPIVYKYDNLCEKPVSFIQDFLDAYSSDGASVVLDPNENPYTVQRTLKNTMYYSKYCKQKEITNFALTEQGIYI